MSAYAMLLVIVHLTPFKEISKQYFASTSGMGSYILQCAKKLPRRALVIRGTYYQ